MCSFESLIGEALLGSGDDRDRSAVRVAVKMAVVSRITCRCGSVLDQSDAVLLSDGAQSSPACRDLAVICPACFAALNPDRVRVMDRALAGGLYASTWNGCERLGGAE